MEPGGTGKRDLAASAEILNPWVSWEWEADLVTCDVLVAMLRCSTYVFPCEPLKTIKNYPQILQQKISTTFFFKRRREDEKNDFRLVVAAFSVSNKPYHLNVKYILQ